MLWRTKFLEILFFQNILFLLQFDYENEPIGGGKVFVTTMPCVSCRKNVHLKNHSHVRCQMLHTLPMHKIKGYRDWKLAISVEI